VKAVEKPKGKGGVQISGKDAKKRGWASTGGVNFLILGWGEGKGETNNKYGLAIAREGAFAVSKLKKIKRVVLSPGGRVKLPM